MKKLQLLIILIGILTIGCNSTESESVNDKTEQIAKNESVNDALQNGDLIFHTSKSRQSQAIQIATNSKYSHMGIIYKEQNKYYVYEAISKVKLTKLEDWISRGKNRHYVVKRLKNSTKILNTKGLLKMKSIGRKYLNKSYDLKFEWSDNKIYCSELVWKIYKEAFNIEIGKLERFGDFDLSDETVQTKIKERYGDKIPEEELVITPDRMFNAENLITIKEE